MVPGPNIPIELTSFIGRSREIAEVLQLIASTRLLTVTGTAGCGKTRLALKVAAEASGRFSDGVYWVELAQLNDPLLLPKTLAKKLKVAEPTDYSIVDGILEALQGKNILLVLDNCEHLRSACVQLVERLLALQGISVLATSREALGIPSEKLYPLAPMAAPPAQRSMDEVGQFEAVQLFVERARAVVPRFTLTAENSGTVASICRQLDGLPLAIELASARINVLTVQQIDVRLHDRYKLLGEAIPFTSSHHQTLRAALDWSYDLLTSLEQIVLRRLSVFSGGCFLATAEAVCAGEGVEREQMLDLLASLISKSLVVAQTLQGSEARYSLLETIRQHAHEKLFSSGEWSLLRDRHLQRYLQIAEEAAEKLSGQYQQIWLNWLEGEYDNIRASLAWTLEAGRIEAGLRIAVAIYQFWTIRDYAEEGLAWIERLLAKAGEGVPVVVRANALAYAVFLAGFRGKITAQIEYGQKAAILVESLGDEDKLALRWALSAQAYGAQAAGNYQTQFNIGKRVIQINRDLGDRYQLGLTLSITSFTAMALGLYDEAQAMLDEAIPLLREAGNPYRIAMALNFLGDLRRCEGNYQGAQAAYEESISLLRKLDAPRDLASALQNLGHAYLRRGEIEPAQALFNESLSLQVAQQNKPGIAECLIGFAALAVAIGLPGAGACLLASAVTMGGLQVVSTWAATRMEYEHTLARASAMLSKADFQAEQVVGRAFSLEQAVAYAQSLPVKGAAAFKARKNPDELTLREREVAASIAGGKSNQEIADELVLSKRTVEKHIAHILVKLGATNRAQIVRWAIENGLV